ncbi:MAG: hypothetical protein RIT81_20885 [Deltaproteobacteria bacterium]
MSKRRTLPLLLLVFTACGDTETTPAGPALLDTPIAAELRIYGERGNLAEPLPVTPAFIGYRGEGDTWVELDPAEAVAFDILHERYALWVVCAPIEGDAQTVSQVLYLHAEDTVRPTVRCPTDIALEPFPALDVEIRETENRSIGIAVGQTQSQYHHIQGGAVTISIAAPEPKEVDVVTLRKYEGTFGLRVERDVQIREGAQFLVDVHAEHADVQTATLDNPVNGTVHTVFITGGGTQAHLHTSESSSVAVVGPEGRDADDIYVGIVEVDGGVHLSYRTDPTKATYRAPEVFEAWELDPVANGPIVGGIELGAAQVATYLYGTEGSYVEALATSTYLGSDATLSLDAPEAAAIVAPSEGDFLQSRTRLHESNRTLQELLDVEMFKSTDALPRAKDGFDVRISARGTSGRLGQR